MFVLNNTYILNQNTVATFRFGMNTFEDDNSLPYDFDPATLGFNPAFVSQMPVKKFPSVTTTGYQGTGFSGVNNRNYYSYGGNGTVTRLAGSHSVKLGADYRIMGVKAENFGQSAGSYTFNGQFTGATVTSSVGRNAIADLLLGYPSSGSFVRNTPVNNFINYYSVYMQDDWRASDKLTMNYGLRLEHETGTARGGQQAGGRLRSDHGEPAQHHHSRGRRSAQSDREPPGAGWTDLCGRERRQRADRQPAGDQAVAARRIRLQHEREDGGARRLRPVLGAVGLRRQQLGRLFRHHHAAAGHDHPDHRRSSTRSRR